MRRGKPATMPPRFTGAYVTAGPYEDEEGERYEVRLERVPGGLRLAEWSGGALRKRAPVLRAADVAGLVEAAREREVLNAGESESLGAAVSAKPDGGAGAPYGSSKGSAGELQEELRVERADGDRVRIARWLYRPGTREWELQEAPLMLPARRYAEAFDAAARAGLLA